ncbi:MAG: DUF885 domain-containing protein [Leptospiraceae bacterium]|nr:DUF885 domain-containing protein [Leptospiraceae bacterium]
MTIAYNREINEQLIPSYKKLHAFFSGEYLNAARSTSGINALPNGDAMYRYYIYYFTTTHKTPEEIYQTGLTEVSRITAEMEKLKNQMGYTGTLKELFNYMQTDKQFMPFKTVQEVLDSNRAVLAKIQPQLQKLFSVAPKTPFEIREVESFRAAAASPQYNRSSADGTRPGIYYIPILDPAKINTTNWPWKQLFYTKQFPGIIIKFPYRRRTLRYLNSDDFLFIRLLPKGGHCIVNHWANSWAAIPTLTKEWVRMAQKYTVLFA